MIKLFLSAATAGAALTTSAAAAPVRLDAPAWVVSPATDSCKTEIDLTGASGAVAPVTLVSNGEGFQLLYAKADAPERAFLPIRIDHKPYANLALRQPDGRSGAMQLSGDTVAALRRGGMLQIGWLVDEPVQARLTGSEQGLTDLKVCGAQVAARYREQQAAQHEAAARAEAELRARELSDEQLAAAKAQKDAAQAEAQRNAAEAERLQAQAAAERARGLAEAEAARQRAEEEARAEANPYGRAGEYEPRGYDPSDPYPYAPPPSYGRRW